MTPRLARIAAWVVAAFWIATGLWAFLGPRSFYDTIATFPPYNVHFIHDAGAFTIGLGSVIALALLGRSALGATLYGVGIGSTVHVVSHVIDYDIEPDASDVFGLAFITVVTFAAAWTLDREPSHSSDSGVWSEP
jgi:hypothetical protein